MGLFDWFGKSSNQTNNADMEKQRSIMNQQSASLGANFANRQHQAQQRNDQDYSSIRSGYQGLLDGSSGTGGSSARSSDYSWGDQFNPMLQSDHDSILAYGRNPISDSDKARMRGGGIYEEYAKTGGWDDKRKNDYIEQGSQVAKRQFGDLSNELARKANVAGNTNAGSYTSSQSRLARDSAHAGQDAVRSAGLDVANSVDKNRQFGAQGMTDSEAKLQALLMQARLGAGQQGNQLALGMMQGADSRAANQGSLDNQSNSLDLQRQFGALSGMRGLRTDVPGEENMANNNLLELFKSTNSGNIGLLNRAGGTNTSNGSKLGSALAPLANSLLNRGSNSQGGNQGGNNSPSNYGGGGNNWDHSSDNGQTNSRSSDYGGYGDTGQFLQNDGSYGDSRDWNNEGYDEYNSYLDNPSYYDTPSSASSSDSGYGYSQQGYGDQFQDPYSQNPQYQDDYNPGYW
jgi:hypothetical protein